MNWHIYVLLDPLSNLVRYVGKTKNVKNRLVKHMCPSKLKASNHKNNWIKNLLKNKLKPNLLIIETCSSEDEVNELEIFILII
jgi:predicted GIY-YIG superfamily endonuclease